MSEQDERSGSKQSLQSRLLVVMFAVGMTLPIYATKTAWIYIIMAYLFLASVMPMWLLMQPRDYMTTFMLLGMIIGAVLGVVVAHPDMELNAFNGFQVGNSGLFPTLFVTIACGAVSGFHSLVSSGTSSKTISNEKDMPMVGYGAMVVEILLGMVSLGRCRRSRRKRNETRWNTVLHLLLRCCRIPGETWCSGNTLQLYS
ncbi:MAG: carbon starvation CstA family protein [Waltera sp.]